MIHFARKLINIEDQKTFIDQLLETAYPAGWKGHQKNFILMNININVVKKPKLEAIVEP